MPQNHWRIIDEPLNFNLVCQISNAYAVAKEWDAFLEANPDEKNPEGRIAARDKRRRLNYQHYTGRTWAMSQNYHICLDTSVLGYELKAAVGTSVFIMAFTALTGNVTEDKALMRRLAEGEYDVLLVNIVADVIIGLSPILPDFMGPRTVLICSGILDSRLADVTDALEAAGLTVTAIRAKEEWRCVTAKKGGSL